ncbi:hypothetical protein PENTCL1PPCAC_11753, partial [Pristionchus entomophagus]
SFSMFRRPDSDDEDSYYPRSGGSSSWGGGGGSKKDALNRQLGEFKKDRFVSGSSQSQQEFYGKQEIKGGDEGSGGGKKLTEDERNKIGAKILKAEMKGDKAAVARLKKKLEGGGDSDEERPSSSRTKEVVMMKRDRSGNVMPARRKERDDNRHDMSSHSRVKREYGKDQDLNAMLKEEKSGTAEDQLRMFERALVSSSKIKRNDDDESIDDIALMQKGKRKHEEKDQKREEKKMKKHHSLLEKSLEDCALCIESKKLNKQCIVAVGLTTYLCTAPWEGLDEEHLLIIPQAHCASSLQLDENVYDEMRLWRRGLVAMWKSAGRDCVFMEMARDVGANQHMFIECIPLEAELGDVAPVYFKKAINECEGEYTDNKKLIELKDMRKQIPRGFSYFTIDFGMQNGYGHVIEIREAFPPTFGTEILAGMMDLAPNRWRKRKELTFEEMKKRTNEVKSKWDDFDWTKRIKRDE